MFEQILSKQAKDALALLGAIKVLPQGTYLAGGTALALQLGHCLSYDFDFFYRSAISRNNGCSASFKINAVVSVGIY